MPSWLNLDWQASKIDRLLRRDFFDASHASKNPCPEVVDRRGGAGAIIGLVSPDVSVRITSTTWPIFGRWERHPGKLKTQNNHKPEPAASRKSRAGQAVTSIDAEQALHVQLDSRRTPWLATNPD